MDKKEPAISLSFKDMDYLTDPLYSAVTCPKCGGKLKLVDTHSCYTSRLECVEC